jgi:hypothetical protein
MSGWPRTTPNAANHPASGSAPAWPGSMVWTSVTRWRRSKYATSICTPSGIHPSSALIGDIAVWRAACGISPKDPRPTGATQLETLSALWKERLDRHIAHSTDLSDNATAYRQRTPNVDAGTTIVSARSNNPNGVRAGRPRAGDNTPSPRIGGTRAMRTPRGDGGTAGNTGHCRIWLFRIKAGAPRRHGACARFAAGRAPC